MEDLLIVSASPHIRHQRTTSRVMLDVTLALLPKARISDLYLTGNVQTESIDAVLTLANDYAEEQEWERQYQQYVAAHAQLRRLIRSLMRILVAVLSSIRSSLLRRLSSVRRQSASDQFVDGMVTSIPVPPTRMLVCGIN